jgi:hypothetical protein
MSDREQELVSRVVGLNAALQKCLAELTTLYGSDARVKLRTMRDELILKFKQSGIPANRELEHAQVVRPSIEAIETAFEGFV